MGIKVGAPIHKISIISLAWLLAWNGIAANNQVTKVWRELEKTEVKALPGTQAPQSYAALCEMDCMSYCASNKQSTACTFVATNETCLLWETDYITTIDNAGAKSILRCMLYTYMHYVLMIGTVSSECMGQNKRTAKRTVQLKKLNINQKLQTN